ncbi:Hydroxypyruvate reductase [Sporomusa rhizae]|uniref:NAD(P)-dependent oxidoreductase n=1 Tax=Sporomusa rhizae TaxID=357999 RepID=UPI00352A3459
MFKRTVLIDNTGIDEFVLQELKALTEELIIYHDIPKSKNEILLRADKADAILVSWNTNLSSDIIEVLPELRYIGMCCSLYDEASSNVDIITAGRKNIVVKGVRDYGDQGVVEFIFSELIRLFLGLGNRSFRSEAVELGGIKFGVVGMGSVGRKVADAAAFFNMEVNYYSRTIKEEIPYKYLPLSELLSQCDVISLHLPRNTVLIDEQGFKEIGAGKVLINTGLGFSFERMAFDEWIGQEGNFAILDTDSITTEFRNEYRTLANVIMNERVSGFTRNARKRLSQKVIDNMRSYLRSRC